MLQSLSLKLIVTSIFIDFVAKTQQNKPPVNPYGLLKFFSDNETQSYMAFSTKCSDFYVKRVFFLAFKGQTNQESNCPSNTP